MSSEQQLFFNSLGIDLTKVDVDKTVYDIPEDEETPASKIYRMSVNFLMRGKNTGIAQISKGHLF